MPHKVIREHRPDLTIKFAIMAGIVVCGLNVFNMIFSFCKKNINLYWHYCGRPWSAAYINFNQNIHQNQVLTKPLCRAQAIFYSLPNNWWGTKYRGLTYSAK